MLEPVRKMAFNTDFVTGNNPIEYRGLHESCSSYLMMPDTYQAVRTTSQRKDVPTSGPMRTIQRDATANFDPSLKKKQKQQQSILEDAASDAVNRSDTCFRFSLR